MKENFGPYHINFLILRAYKIAIFYIPLHNTIKLYLCLFCVILVL